MGKPVVSVEEYIGIIKRSFLPTVVTEGSDDYKFYRRIESTLASMGVSLFPVGGRKNVLEIFKRRNEIGRNNVIFLVDKDLWIYEGVPPEYAHRKIILTNGYAIENDLYCDGDIESFLHDDEKARFARELDALIHWYSFAAAKMLAAEPSSISEHPAQVLNENGCLNEQYMMCIGYLGRNNELYELVKDNYKYLLRGKNLINLILRRLSHSKRAIKFGRDQIMEIGAARQGPNMNRITSEISELMPIL